MEEEKEEKERDQDFVPTTSQKETKTILWVNINN